LDATFVSFVAANAAACWPHQRWHLPADGARCAVSA
jgi:hypothetical protein